jgi:hypothetical protein
MQKRTRIALSIIAVLAIAAVITLIVAELRYGAIRAGKPESHARFVTDATRARIFIRPLMARNLIDAWFPSDRTPPAWILTRVLPHELAFVLTPRLATHQSDISIYVNEQRLGPLVADVVNRSGFMGQYGYIHWNTDVTLERRGALAAHGQLDIPDRVANTALDHWGIVQGLEPLDVDGTHFFEAIFDNRDGGTFALMCALYNHGLLGQPQIALEDEYETFLSIASIHVYADATAAGDVQLIVILESAPGARAEDIDANAFNLEVAIGEIARFIREQYGAELRGRAWTDGSTVTGRYTVKNVAGIISTLLEAQ